MKKTFQIKDILKKSLNGFLPTLKDVGGLLVWLSLLIAIPSQMFQYLATLPTDTFRITSMIGSAILEVFFWAPLFFILVPGSVHHRIHNSGDFNAIKYFKIKFPIVLEQWIRVVGQMILWGLLFIIPGFIRYAQLLFVPFIAQFDSTLVDKQIDPLKVSREIWKRAPFLKTVGVISLVAIFGIGADLASTAFPLYRTPFLFLPIFLVLILVEVFGQIVLYNLYIALKE